MTRIIHKLIEKLRQNGIQVPKDAKFRRLYVGRWQRSAGAWVWSLQSGIWEIGSCSSVTVCVKSKTLTKIRGGEICPD